MNSFGMIVVCEIKAVMIKHLQDGAMEEENDELNEIQQDITVFLLNADDVGQRKRSLRIYPTIR